MIVGPILTRELALAPRRPQHYLSRGVYGLALFVLMATAWLIVAGTQHVRNAGDMARFGQVLFQVLSLLQLAVMIFLAALTAASSVAIEKDRKTIILLLLTRLHDHELVLGKLLASLVDTLSMLAVGLPIFLLTTLLGGVATEQVLRVFAITLVAALTAGSLGSLMALWREKTFQALSLTVLCLVAWIGAWETIGWTGGAFSLGGASAGELAAALSPFRAVWSVLQPAEVARGGLAGPETAFLCAGLLMAGLLNLAAVVFLRVWNPGRDLLPRAAAEEAGSASLSGPEQDRTQAKQPAANESTEQAAARAGHIDARVRAASQASRRVWDNPILWREVCTWAYGKKIVVIRVVYVLLFALTAAALLNSIASGAALARDWREILPPASRPLAPFFTMSLVMVNALAVTSITTERDGGALDLLLVTDLTPREFVFGKLLGVAWVVKEMIVLPMLLAVLLWAAGGLSLENLLFLLVALAVMNLFVIVLGLHCGMNYAASRAAIAVSLGNVFFLFLGVATLVLFIISFSGSFQTQLAPFLAFIVGGGVAIFVSLGIRNPSGAIATASILLPFFTFFAVTSYLLPRWDLSFLSVVTAYSLAIAAMLVPALSNFDFALGRSRGGEHE